jgi:hypothetical protein
LALWDGPNVELKCQIVRSLYGVWPLTASMEVKNKYAYVITQDICNKFIEVFFLWDVWSHRQIVCSKIRLPCLLLIRFPVFIFRRKPRYRNLSHAHCYPTSSPRIKDENTLRVSLQSRIHQVEPTLIEIFLRILIVGKTFPGFHALGVQNCFL